MAKMGEFLGSSEMLTYEDELNGSNKMIRWNVRRIMIKERTRIRMICGEI